MSSANKPLRIFTEREDNIPRNVAIQTAWFQGHVHGLQEYAWWKDGVQYVGTCGATLAEAIEEAQKKYRPDYE